MSGMSISGFVPATLEEIKSRIITKLLQLSPSFDITTESPDGQLIDIFSFEIYQLWNELSFVYESYDPDVATGAALRNLGFITGLPFGVATRSRANITLNGTAGTIIPRYSIVENDNGDQFATEFEATIPSNVNVSALVSGPIEVQAGSINTIVTPINGWDSIIQSEEGTVGDSPLSESQYRNLRTKTVLRNYTSVEDTISARLLELGVSQINITNNDSNTAMPDGTPAHTLHITIGELQGVTDEDIAAVILATKGIGCPTYGSTTIIIEDSQGVAHSISFTKAQGVTIYIDVDVTFLDEENAGAEERIKEGLNDHINNLLAGEDVIWSRLFSVITPYAKAQVNTLFIGKSTSPTGTSNIVIDNDEYAVITDAEINLTVT